MFDKYLNNADYASREYREESKESGKGIDLTKDELVELDELVSPLILKGQPVSHIFAGKYDTRNGNVKKTKEKLGTRKLVLRK